MKIDVSAIPYTDADEEQNIRLVKAGRYNELILYNKKLTNYITSCMHKGLNVNVPLSELKAYVETGFYLAVKAYKSGTFFDFVVFYIEQYAFHQVYTEYFLTALPITKRIDIQKLYTEVLKYLDTNSGVNYYDAIMTASDNINMPLDKAINLMATFMQMSVKEPDEYAFTEEIDKMEKWVHTKKRNLLDAPLTFLLSLMEAQMQKYTGHICTIPFTAICEKFFDTALVH